MSAPAKFDLFIIGGGINGCGIARDAAGRGLRVGLAEMNDLASATSSASTKLFHGGLRYLEYFEIKLVREALIERETLLRAMPHIAWPMRFVLPYHPEMRFEGTTPASRLLSAVFPWMKGRRPAWMIRFGLFLYDHLGGRKILPPTRTLHLPGTPEGAPIDDRFQMAWEYSDVWVQDSRLVVLNARDAEARGATILTRTRVTEARREGDLWRITLDAADGPREVTARALVNAAGPWTGEVLADRIQVQSTDKVRLVRGSHIVTRRLYDHDKCYFFQGVDGRIIFAIPYEQDYTLIGTTDVEHDAPDHAPDCTEAERDYLIDFANRYFKRDLTPKDVVWTYSGVRPLHDDGAANARAVSRDYTLKLDTDGPVLLSVFGGKITTYRHLAETALARLKPHLPGHAGAWTAGVALPGGDFPVGEVSARIAALSAQYPFLSSAEAQRLFRRYGTETADVLGAAKTRADLGRAFGGGLTEVEVRWQIAHEYARTAEDVVWRRTRTGIGMTSAEIAEVEAFMALETGRAAV